MSARLNPNRRCIRCGNTAQRYGQWLYCWSCVHALQTIRQRVRAVLSWAISSGMVPAIETQYCVDCGAFAKFYDHRDYSRPTLVEPVCHGCNLRRGPAESESLAA